MIEFLKKLTSRKFLAAAAGLISGLSLAFGLDDGIVSAVSGAVLAGASLISYIITEGRIDAKKAADAATKLQNAADEISGD